jgi:hypothetical protein
MIFKALFVANQVCGGQRKRFVPVHILFVNSPRLRRFDHSAFDLVDAKSRYALSEPTRSAIPLD